MIRLVVQTQIGSCPNSLKGQLKIPSRVFWDLFPFVENERRLRDIG